MAKAAHFIISLDCEGKWGMADHLQPYHHRLLTDEALRRAYEQLVALFDRYQVPATFAFVMAFVLDRDEQSRFAPELLGDSADAWLRPYQEAFSTGLIAGWHQPEVLEVVRAARVHEIACHGFCHRPLAEDAISAEGAGAELDAALEVARVKGLKLETFVFPRNGVGHVDALRSRGFTGYRERLRRPGGPFGRALNVVEEFNLWAQPQQPAAPYQGLVPIPSGRFFNWQFGLRAIVPNTATVARWRQLLRRAVAKGGVAHLWFHPHNLITGPGTAELLEQVLAEVATLCKNGDLRVLTQRDYCLEQLAA